MNYRKLGRSDLEVSEISFGCWTLGGLNWVNGQPNGWANVDEDEVVEAVKAGLDAGVNHFDNADVYGNGRAERMLARVLARLASGVELIQHRAWCAKIGHHAVYYGWSAYPDYPAEFDRTVTLLLARQAVRLVTCGGGRTWVTLPDGAVS